MKELNEYSTQLIRELIIPKLTKEVNSSKRYAALRQVFFSLVMARWFKDTFQGKPGQYAQLIDSHNLNNLTSKEAWSKTYYFNEYKKSFEQGELELKVQGGVDWFLEFTESSLRHALMLAKHQPWAGRLYRRERAKTLIRRQDDSPAGLAQVTEVQGYLEQEGIPCFVSRSSNRYSAQIRGREIGPATLMVVVKEFGRNRLLPLAECSVLLAGTEEKQILITQLYVQQEDHARALAVIQGRMQ